MKLEKVTEASHWHYQKMKQARQIYQKMKLVRSSRMRSNTDGKTNSENWEVFEALKLPVVVLRVTMDLVAEDCGRVVRYNSVHFLHVIMNNTGGCSLVLAHPLS